MAIDIQDLDICKSCFHKDICKYRIPFEMMLFKEDTSLALSQLGDFMNVEFHCPNRPRPPVNIRSAGIC